MTQPLMIEAFSAPSLRGTGALVDGAFALPENQTAKGMGNLGQLFAGGGDPSTWGIGEWSVVGIGGYVAIKLFFDVKNIGSAVGRKTKSTGRKVKKKSMDAAATGTSAIGTVAVLAGLGIAAYFIYQHFQPATTAVATEPVVTP